LNQQKKNYIGIGVLLSLIILCVIAANYDPYKKNSATINPNLFAVSNPAETLTKAKFKGNNVNNTLEKKQSGWRVNDSLRLDQAMFQVLTALLERVEVQQVVSGDLKEQVKRVASDTGVVVKLYTDDRLMNSFTVAGNMKAIKTYFVQDDEVYLMQLPGYESYVAGMFEVKTIDWQDRTVFSGTWQDIVSLTLQYPEGGTLFFKYDEGLIKLQNSKNADSVKVMNYIESFNYFYVDQFLDADFEAVQMVDEFSTAGSIHIRALDERKNLNLQFYEHPDFNAILVHINGRQWAGIQQKRFEQYFPKKISFIKGENSD